MTGWAAVVVSGAVVPAPAVAVPAKACEPTGLEPWVAAPLADALARVCNAAAEAPQMQAITSHRARISRSESRRLDRAPAS